MNFDKDLVANCFEGNPEKLETALEYGRRFSMSWDDIVNIDNCFPEKQQEAQHYINRYLGYKPDPLACLQNEPFLRAISVYHDKGLISDDQFIDELEFHLKLIRNADMKIGGWNYSQPYIKEDYDQYETYLPHLKHAARDRLCDFTNHKPLIEHALDAELFLRDCFTVEGCYPQMDFGQPFDLKCITILCYRREFFRGGQSAADDLILFGWNYEVMKSDQKK